LQQYLPAGGRRLHGGQKRGCEWIR
jgi:hypothetical protein